MISDISRKQLERISTQERVQIVIVHENDSALIFREATKQVETLVPEAQQGQPITTSAYQTLLVMTFLTNPSLVEQAKKIVEAQQEESNK
jgi:hypothetical protein